MKELTFNPQIDVQQCVLWQYANSPALRTLLQAKSDFYQQNVTQFWNDWFNDVFNINTATDFGLTVWGEILDFPRQIKSNTGTIHNLTTEQYRTILKGQLLKFRMDGTVPQVNEWLKVVFGNQGNVFCLDNLDMTAIPFVFETNPTDEILWLLSNVDFLPRPAGVGYEVRIIGNDVFGFNGSGLQPFNQGTFYKNWNTDLDIDQGLYQLSINAPEGATVTINGLSGNYQSMVEGTEYTWSVTREGYLPVSGSGTLTQDTTINVYQISITTNAPNPTITINGETAVGAFFLAGTTFVCAYTVSAPMYSSFSNTVNATKTSTINARLHGKYSVSASVPSIPSEPITVLFEETIPFPFQLQAQLGARVGSSIPGTFGGFGGRILFTAKTFPANSNVQVVAIKGGVYQHAQGGTGIGLIINGNPVAVAGGGASANLGGGGGYIGGYSATGYTNLSGYSITGSQPTVGVANKRTGQSGEAFGGAVNGNYGGSSYLNLPDNVSSLHCENSTTTTGSCILNFTEVF